MDAPGSFDLNSAPVWQHLMEILEKLFPTDGSCSKREVDMKSGYEPQPSSGEYQPSTIPEIHKYEYMHPNFLEGPLLEVDPFAILTCLLLSVSTFFPIIDTSNMLWKKSACNTLFINYLS
jgi:hypothetical protein